MSGFARAAASVPAGTIIQLATPTVPKGWLATNGILLPQVGQYSKLFAAIQHTYKKSTETSAALNAAGKFRLPNDDQGRFLVAAQPVYDMGGVSAWTGNGVTSTIAGQYMFAKRLEQDPADMSGPFWFSRTCGFRTVPAGKYYIPFRVTGNPGSVMANVFSAILMLKNGADFFRFGMVIERNGSGVYEKEHQFVKCVGGVITTQTIPALQTTPVATHVEREWVFYWDTAGAAGIYCDGVYYGTTLGFPTHVTSWTPNILLGALPTPIITGGIDLKIIEAAYVEKFDLATQLPGYSAALEVGKTWEVATKGGADSHIHTASGTALTKAHLPANVNIQVVEAGNSTSWMGQAQAGSNLTSGGGQTHTHTLTTESNMPPYIRSLFAIKY